MTTQANHRLLYHKPIIKYPIVVFFCFAVFYKILIFPEVYNASNAIGCGLSAALFVGWLFLRTKPRGIGSIGWQSFTCLLSFKYHLLKDSLQPFIFSRRSRTLKRLSPLKGKFLAQVADSVLFPKNMGRGCSQKFVV